MKIVFGTLLFTLVVFFNSIEISSQSTIGGAGSSGGSSSGGSGIGGSSSGGSGSGASSSVRRPPYNIIVRHLNPANSGGIAEGDLGNLVRDHHIVLPNGNIYVSTGTGRIHITYHVPSRTAKVEQEGSEYVHLTPRQFPPRVFNPGEWVTIVQLHGPAVPIGHIVQKDK